MAHICAVRLIAVNKNNALSYCCRRMSPMQHVGKLSLQPVVGAVYTWAAWLRIAATGADVMVERENVEKARYLATS